MRRRCQIATPGGWCETGGAVGVPCRDGGAAGDAARMRIPSRTFGSAHRCQRKIASARKQQRPASGTAPASTCGPPREGAETGTSQRGTAQRSATQQHQELAPLAANFRLCLDLFFEIPKFL